GEEPVVRLVLLFLFFRKLHGHPFQRVAREVPSRQVLGFEPVNDATNQPREFEVEHVLSLVGRGKAHPVRRGEHLGYLPEALRRQVMAVRDGYPVGEETMVFVYLDVEYLLVSKCRINLYDLYGIKLSRI